MLFSERDIDALRLICWCQYIRPADLSQVVHTAEIDNLICFGLIKFHAKSNTLVLTSKGRSLMRDIFTDEIPVQTKSYHSEAIQRRIRQSRLAITWYHGGVDVFTANPESLSQSPSLFFSAFTRERGANPWGNTRIAALSHLGDMLCAVYCVFPSAGKLSLTDELTAFTNQTARFRNTKRAFIFAGETYGDILTELENSRADENAKLIYYGDAYRCLQLPVHLLSCNDTGAVQLQIMSVPDYRRRLTQAALKKQYQTPPADAPAWDALFQGLPFVMAADMDLRRIDTAVETARRKGFQKIAVAALEGQAETVLFDRYRDTGLARVFTLTQEAVTAVTGRPPMPFIPAHTQFLTQKGDVVNAPPLQTSGKAGGPR